MVALSFIILTLCLLCDLVFSFSIGSVHIKPLLGQLFLYFLLFRVDLRFLLLMTAYYLCLVAPFTGVSVLSLGLSLVPLLVVISFLREQLFAESYLAQAFWVAMIHAGQQILLTVLRSMDWGAIMAVKGLMTVIINAVFLAALSILIFVFWDRCQDFFSHMTKRRHVDPADVLRTRRYKR